MRRKWMGFLSMVCLVMGVILPVRAAEVGSAPLRFISHGSRIMREGENFSSAQNGAEAVFRMMDGMPEEKQRNVIQTPPAKREEEAPLTGDRHVPLIGAMGIGFSVAVLMVLTDQRKE